jgi:uncharacterized protein YjbK
MSPREKELKLRLKSREDYDKLLAARELVSGGALESQENHYFDTAGRDLLRAGAMLRLRLSGKLWLTFKQGGDRPRQAGYFDVLELEVEVERGLLEEAIRRPAALLEHPSAPAREVRRRFGHVELTHLGSLRNERLRCARLPYLLEIDRLSFPGGGEAYEIEIETEDPEGARRWIETELARRGIAAEPQERTKLEELLGREGEG